MAVSGSAPALAFRVSSAVLCCRTTSRLRLLLGALRPFPSSAAPPRRSYLALVAFARRKSSSASTKREEAPRRRKSTLQNSDWDEDDIDDDDDDDDAFEELFSQLEEDLKNDKLLSDDADDDISEEDLAKLEEELDEALDGGDIDEDEDEDEDEDDDDEESRPKLKSWQLRKLAHALKIGRRKTGIKNLAAELGLGRAYVLELLRDPPPDLFLLSASLPDEITQTSETSSKYSVDDITQTPELESKMLQSPPTTAGDDLESKPVEHIPVHAMQNRWLSQKRLKKVQIEILESIYSRAKRPNNEMISSIVYVTKLPWKRIVLWFEERRHQDAIPELRSPYRRSSPETISTR